MTTQTTISRLTIAAAILIAAAIPSLAQSKSADISTRNVLAASGSGFELALNRAPVSANNFRSAETKKIVEQPETAKAKLSPATFMSNRFSYVNEKASFSPQFKIYDTAKFDSKPQFRTDVDAPVTASKNRITFVPSLGQKIPS